MVVYITMDPEVFTIFNNNNIVSGIGFHIFFLFYGSKYRNRPNLILLMYNSNFSGSFCSHRKIY